MKYIIPSAALQQHIIVLGKTGAGKSSAMRAGFVEPMLGDNWPVCILDPKGDWWGLKSSADGRKPGYAVVIFGGPHADVPINEHSGAHVAELFATGNRPCIIDLSDFTVGERTRFFMNFAATLYRRNRGKKWVVMDECHNFAPQGKVMDVDSGKALHWANKLASEGRGRGLNLIAASQRPQKVHKDFITSMETLIAMRVIHNLDRGAIKEWIDGCADKSIGKELLDQLATMKRGEAWIWSPEVNFGPKLIVFPMFNTYDSFKPREADAGELEGWAAVDLNDVKEKMAVLVNEAQANDPKMLRKRIADLEEQLANSAGYTPKEYADDLGKARQEGYERGHQDGFNAAKEAHAGKAREAAGYFQKLVEIANEAAADIARQSSFFATQLAVGTPNPPPTIKLTSTKELPPRMPPMRVTRTTEFSETLRPALKKAHDHHHQADYGLPIGERAVLSACIQHPVGLERTQLTVLTGYKKSSRDSYIARLQGKGYLETSSDRRIRATDAGRAALPDFEPLPKGRALQEYWMERLPPGERIILTAVIKAYPHTVKRDSLDKEGYKKSARDSYISRLAAKNLLKPHGAGFVIASDDLF